MIDFDSYIEKALKEMPKEFKNKLENVAIFVRDFPTLEQAKKFNLRKEQKMLLGLYEGIPQTNRGHYGVGGAVPDKITLFRVPILQISRTEEELVKQIQATLFHEIGHHFGLSEDEIRKAERKSSLSDGSTD